MAKVQIKSALRSKTVWAGIATIAGGVGAYFAGEQSLQEVIIALVGVVFTVLRFVTTEPIDFK